METFDELLRQKKAAIVERWLKVSLSAYPKEGSAAFLREQDPFANPVGHALRTGVGAIFEALLNGLDSAKVRDSLQDILSIRAVQDLSAPRALGFIFELKDTVRAEVDSASDQRFERELAEFDSRVDKVALAAFDVFVQCRERLCELRINEVKRQVSWVVGKVNARGVEPDAPPFDPDDPATSCEVDPDQEGM
jgi:hypothetical protein